MTVRVLIADRSEDTKGLIRTVLAREPAFEVVAEAADGYETLRFVDEHQPDVVLMDLMMAGCNGLLLTRLIKRRWPQVIVVVLTVSDDAIALFEAIRSGAQGYLLKSLDPEDWVEYLRGFACEEWTVPRGLAGRILSGLTAAPKVPAPIEMRLTGREADVLRLVARALSNRQIARRLRISEQTVKHHVKSILLKLHQKNRTGLALYAKDHGLDSD